MITFNLDNRQYIRTYTVKRCPRNIQHVIEEKRVYFKDSTLMKYKEKRIEIIVINKQLYQSNKNERTTVNRSDGRIDENLS